MKLTCMMASAVILIISTTAFAAIYKWVDEKGTTHFSDKPSSGNAEKIEVQGTGITVDLPDRPKSTDQGEHPPNASPNPALPTSPAKVTTQEFKEKVVTEDDYRITANVGKLGADMIGISGRIGSGPVCKSMVVTATARNENGLSGSITKNISKSTSFGSTIFEGMTRVAGSRDDLSFWKIDNVTVRCND